jgi:hypothetical protein
MATTTINLGLSLDGLSNVDSTGKNNGDILRWNSTTNKWEDNALPTTAPAGSSGQIQFNDSGAFGADSLLVWDNTNKRLGVGASPASTVRLDVRAQGALSTDIAFRVRNSADTGNLLEVLGNGVVFARGAGNVSSNTAFGQNALDANTSGSENSAFGENALTSLTTGTQNTAFGRNSAFSLSTQSGITAIGCRALQDNTAAGATAIGSGAMISTTNAQRSSAIGINAGRFISDGATSNLDSQDSVFIGAATKALANAQTNQIVIGYNAIGAGSNTTTIGNTSITAAHIRGAVICGDTVALATNATNGFLYIPTCAGVPTGVPTAYTGKAAMVADSTGNKLYVYLGGAWVAMN